MNIVRQLKMEYKKHEFICTEKQLLGELWLQSHKSCEKLLSVAKP